jgi:hypothetical protein
MNKLLVIGVAFPLVALAPGIAFPQSNPFPFPPTQRPPVDRLERETYPPRYNQAPPEQPKRGEDLTAEETIEMLQMVLNRLKRDLRHMRKQQQERR